MSPISNFFRHLSKARQNSNNSKNNSWFAASWLISLAGHPLLMPTFLHGILLKYCGDLVPMKHDAKVKTMIFIFVGTYIIPSIATGFLWATGVISSLSLEKRSERLIPLLVTGLIYTGISYIFLDYMEMTQILGAFMGIIALTIFITAAITRFWKISSHMIGIGGLVGFIFSVVHLTNNLNLEWPLLMSILCAGAVASSRLFLNAHNWSQIAAGFLLGFILSCCSIYFFI